MKLLNVVQTWLENTLGPVANWIENNQLIKALTQGFMYTMPVTFGAAIIAVASPTFFRAMRDVARQYECDYLEMKWAEPVPFKGARLQGVMPASSPDYDPYELLRQTLEIPLSEDVIPMLILHPGFIDLPLVQSSSLLKPRILEADMASSQKAKELLRRCDAQVVAYHEL